MSIWIRIIDGIIQTICIEIKPVNGIGIEIGDIINGDETAGFGVVVSGFQEIEASLCVEVVTAITEGVKHSDMGGVCDFLAGCIQHTAVAPGGVSIFYQTVLVLSSRGIRISNGVIRCCMDR